MKLYIDCEFNGFKGHLMSMALVAEDGSEFYEVLEASGDRKWQYEDGVTVTVDESCSKVNDATRPFRELNLKKDGGDDIGTFKIEAVDPIDEWVCTNVVPILNKDPITLEMFQAKLMNFLKFMDDITIVADWFDDIKYFNDVVITEGGMTFMTQKVIKFEVVRVDADSALKHNALEDARGLKKHIEGLNK